MASKEIVAKGIAYLFSMYPREKANIDADTLVMMVDGWQKQFSQIEDQVFLNALEHHVAAGKYFPSVAEVHDCISRIEEVAEGSTDWASAWDVLKRAISRYGAWGTPEEIDAYFADKLPPAGADDLRFVVQRLKFATFCAMETDQEQQNRANFRDVFNLAKKSRIERRRMHPETLKLISDLAQKFAAERARLQAPRQDDEDMF